MHSGLEKFKTDSAAMVKFEQSLDDLVGRVERLHEFVIHATFAPTRTEVSHSTLNDVADKASRIFKRSRRGRWWHSKEDVETLTDLKDRVGDAVSTFQVGDYLVRMKTLNVSGYSCKCYQQ